MSVPPLVPDLLEGEVVHERSEAEKYHSEIGRKRHRREKNIPPRLKPLPPVLDTNGPDSNFIFNGALTNNDLQIDPADLNLIPNGYWISTGMSFSDLVTKFFRRKNNPNTRFPHKLFNALLIVESMPDMWNLIGVKWVTDTVFLCDKYIFGRLLGIQSFDGGLFHMQGNFPSHGFRELLPEEVQQCQGVDLANIDFDRLRLLKHTVEDAFTRNSDEETVIALKWSGTNTHVNL